MGRIVIGTCGFQRSRKLHYENLDGVEVQQTFYDPRDISRLEAWRMEAPSIFIFTMKAWMLVTHPYNKKLWRRLKEPVPGSLESYGYFRDTEEVWWAWDRTLEAAKALDAEIIVLQTPASFRRTEDNMKALAGFLERAERGGRTLAWEPRGDWWSRPEDLAKVAEEYELLIVGDPLKGRTPIGGKAYIRLHGLGGEVNYRYKYTREDLDRLAAWMSGEERDVYAMFNNIYAYEDALTLKTLLEG